MVSRPPAAPGRLHSLPARAPQPASEASERQRHHEAAARLHERARHSAEAGDIAAAAQSILQALDHERRAGVLGPQVLQLIKPR